MSADRYLITPPEGTAAELLPLLERALSTGPASALLVVRGTRQAKAYDELVRVLTPVAQRQNCAVLIEGDAALATALAVDGLHVSGDLGAVKAAVAALKPQAIVGFGGASDRHEAMTAGELGVDYILFGPISGAISDAEREMARWWAETMEIPSVLSDPAANAAEFEAEGCEFMGLSLHKAGVSA